MKVLIVKTSALGDVVHALPVLAYLKSAGRDIQIDWLVEEAFAPLLADHPLVNRVIALRTKAWRRAGFFPTFSGVWQVIRRLRRQGYDRVLDLQGNSKSGFFTLFAGAPKRFGFDRNGRTGVAQSAGDNVPGGPSPSGSACQSTGVGDCPGGGTRRQ
ncbi:MAG: glycosyltransferase family 9 protein [Desulfobacterales bacterium]|nr:glycosyltransferase family 9 protein [Desulfobacterales bacterium]